MRQVPASGLSRSLALIALTALALVSLGGAQHASALSCPVANPTLITSTVNVATLPSCFTGFTSYLNTMGSVKDSMSYGVFSLTVPSTTVVDVTVSDLALYGDYYALWQSSSSTMAGAASVGTASPVDTDLNLVGTFYNPFWTGTGSVYSSATFPLSLSAGTHYFVVQDVIQDVIGAALDLPCQGSPQGATLPSPVTAALLGTNCDQASPSIHLGANDWTGSSYTISFTVPATGAPEFGLSSVAVAAAALPILALVRARAAERRP